ncbi:LamG-like jellyroll fold domain-containing protein [Streptomyces griseosporeus]|uniref:LamG-like jellyroll fold domain-containing protein n=1 Tax=Streptomyces griseosporeus TaxID=1910 RepID=UPI0036A0E0F5
MGVALAVGLVPATVGSATAGESVSAVSTEEGTQTSGAVTEAQALAKAKRTGQSVEITGMRRETREVFATPAGVLEAREYLRPVWSRGKQGWQRVDTTLTVTDGGMVAPKAATVDVAFSGGGSAPLVRIERAGRQLSLFWPTALPKPRLDGAVATYPSVLPNVDLRMTAQEDGFTQLLVVKTPEAATDPRLAELRLKLSAEGLSVQETDAGGLAAVDAGAKSAVFEAPKPMMWDSGGRADGPSTQLMRTTVTGEPGVSSAEADSEPVPTESSKLAPVGVDVPAGQKELVLTPDAGVLKGADTTYPVYIDPQWYSPRASAWTMVSKYWATSPQWKFNGENNAGLGYCGWSYCQPYDTKRLFYRIPVSAFAGKTILSAEFVVRDVWSASCSARNVELWRTNDISSSTTWNSQTASGFWIERLRTESFAYGYEGCAAKDAEFDVKPVIQRGANYKWSAITFGMQASDETDAYGWKRFADDAYLRVQYNRPPAQIKTPQLSMQYGGTCKYSPAPRVRSLGTIYATNITDPDGDNVAVQFQAKWDSGDGKGLIARWSPALTGYKPSGSSFAINLPTSIPQEKQILWYARTYDGAQYSPWSFAGDATACYFYYDTKAPAQPTITSGDYPKSNTENPDDPWYDGIGKYGTFTVGGNDSQAVKYLYGINVDPSPSNAVTTTNGAAKQLKVLPSFVGVNTLYVSSMDAAGNVSAPAGYRFRVKAGQPERAMWQLDDAAGAAQAAGSAPTRTADLKGGAVRGVAGVKGTAVSFDGVDDYAVTDIPTVDTSGDFSVSAWAKLSTLPDHAAIIAAQPGNHSPGFELYYSQSYDRWVFNQYASDDPDPLNAKIVRVMQPTAGGAKVGEWTHLVGTYSSTTNELKLFVNGSLVGTTTYDTPWDARRGLQIGAGSYNGTPGSFFPGAIDEVQLFDKPLSPSEVTRLYGKESLIAGRPARAVFSMDDQADPAHPDAPPTLTGQAEIPDARFSGGVKAGQPGIAGTALELNGTDAYATTGRPILDNRRSFAVSAWAKLPATKPNHAAIIATQTGTQRPGMELYYSADLDRWVVNQYSADSSSATITRAMQPDGTHAYANTWTHLVGVHDTVANKLTLYVNGVKAGETPLQSDWYAGGAFQIGAGSYSGAPNSYFPGQIDDVRLYDRPVSAQEVQQMFRQRPLVKGRWNFESQTAGTPVTSPDSAVDGHAVTLNGGAKIGAGRVDFSALELDGIDDYAFAQMPVDTSSSFTITAWAQAAAVPTRSAAVVSGEGTYQNAFDLRFVPDAANPSAPGRWEVAMTDKDTTSSSTETVSSTEFVSVMDWNHLALAYDGFTKEARLYVNGVLQAVVCDDLNGDGTPDTPGCSDLLAWAQDVLTFQAGKSLQIGRSKSGEYFPGLIDDVWAFQGALNESQVSELAGMQFDIPTEVPAGS